MDIDGLLNLAVASGASLEDIQSVMGTNPARQQIVPGPAPIAMDIPYGQEFDEPTGAQPMGLLDQKRAAYDARTAASQPPANPFAWLTNPAPPGTVATQPTDASQWEGTPMDRMGKGLAEYGSNVASGKYLEDHPIYSNVGLEGLQQELSEGLVADNALEPYEDRVQRREERVNEAKRQEALVQAADIAKMAPNEGEDPAETDVRQKVLQSSDTAKQRGDDTANVDALSPDASVEEVTAANSMDLKNNTEQKAKANGSWSSKWQDAWDKFNEDVDLTTLGLSLMMNSGNGGSLTENLGIAMSQGIAARQAQIDRGTAAGAAGRKEAREERGTRVDEYEAETRRMEVYRKRYADVMAKAADGVQIDMPSGTEQNLMIPWLDRKIDDGGFGAEMDEADKNAFLTQVKTAASLPGAPTDLNQLMEDVWNRNMSIDPGWSIGPTYRYGATK